MLSYENRCVGVKGLALGQVQQVGSVILFGKCIYEKVK